MSRGIFGEACLNGQVGVWRPSDFNRKRIESLGERCFAILQTMELDGLALPGKTKGEVVIANLSTALTHQSSINADNSRINVNLSQTVVEQQLEIKDLRNRVEMLSPPASARGRRPNPVRVPQDEDEEESEVEAFTRSANGRQALCFDSSSVSFSLSKR